ncbi:MAG: hypothetical protein COU06_01565 [Candidatus Harrisonbacteria bacterium CG10_big_fil_rev_8_21_14_0_10_38_8]|uniref:Fibronectin type-III domain-containing protein n=1 Tax=Candidatus Harrisonbacteria bacterium CG10_big_fil_rev_8_21_14_0_10_38_8 TaxID=1974582 RepID=A0A2M6WK70_9BACT|nr:MAG: hypothetical protein COU06_01565 [Candidatus Harrisonbacteria bacterium CG10_big_fil_rev_8_21_14_0_10_38_8]
MKKTLLALFILPFIALGSGQNFYEFAPDSWASERLTLPVGQAVYQLFEVKTERKLNGFDFWLDNDGPSTSVTFTISDGEVTLLTTTKNISNLPPDPGGYKIHVDLDKEVTLVQDKTYLIQISSSSSDIGLYYSDRLNLITHNQTSSTELIFGAAQIGTVIQDFTFKLALYQTPPSGGSTILDEDNSLDKQFGISNARIIAVSDTAVLVGWSTGIATDSRVSIRTQSNPVFVYKTIFDPTYELEHTIAVTGLLPSVNYFADIYSNQGSLSLSSQTITFTTLSEPASEEVQNLIEEAEEAQNPTQQAPVVEETESAPTETEEETTPAQAEEEPTQTPEVENSNQSANTNPTSDETEESGLPEIVFEETTAGGDLTISWEEPETEPVNGYRIDVFDHNNVLERSILVPSGTNQIRIPRLGSGVHNIVIYADHGGGVYIKVSKPTQFSLKTDKSYVALKTMGITSLWILIPGGYFTYRFKKERKKTILPPEEGYDPDSFN